MPVHSKVQEDESTNVNLKWFNMDAVEPGRTVTVTGKRNSGKSVFMVDLMYNLRNKIDIIVCIVGSADTALVYSKYMPPTHIHVGTEFPVDILEKLLELCKSLETLYQRTAAPGSPPYETVKRNIAIWIDDMMGDPSWTKDKKVNTIMVNGRHAGITIVLAVQYYMFIPQSLKSQTDLTFVFNDDSPEVLTRLYKGVFKSYHKMWANEKEFQVRFNTLTHDYHILCVNRTTTSKGGGEIRIYKAKSAKELGDFTIGSDEFWTLYLRHCKNQDELKFQAIEEFNNVVGQVLRTAKSKPRKSNPSKRKAPAKRKAPKRKASDSDEFSFTIERSPPRKTAKARPVRMHDSVSLDDGSFVSLNSVASGSKVSYRK